MKKLLIFFSVFLFLSFSVNTINPTAQVAQSKKFKEGFYNITDLGLMENVSYNVQNVSDFKGFLIVFDSDQKVQQAISLEPRSQKHPLKTIRNSDRVVILGQGELIFVF